MSRTGTGVAVLLCTLLLSQAVLAGRASGRTDVAVRARNAGSMSALMVPRFSSPAWIDAGKNPARVVAADLNADGKADLATVDWSAATVSVMFGDGTGQFRPRFTYRTGRRPAGLVASDFNGDGRLDLASASTRPAKSITVFINRGGGRFRRTGAYAAGRGAYGVAAGDVNQDGIIDLIGAHANNRYLSVLLGRPAGGFRVAYRYRGGWAYDVAVGGLNGDGMLDAVLADSEHQSVTVRLGQGDGRFAPARFYKSGSMPFGVAVADLNHDGALDIAAANFGGASASVLLGVGDGSLGPRTRYPMGEDEYEDYVDAVVVADFDRDGHLDIATPGGQPSVRRGRGDGTFENRQPAFGGFAFTQAGAVADFNSDGWPDLAFSEACDGIEIDCDYYPASSIAVMLNWTGQPVPPCVVPALVPSATERQAKRSVALAGCRVGRVRHRYSRRGWKGTVIRQRPKPWAVLANNSPVNLVISRGRRR